MKVAAPPPFRGQTVVCIASGPSLTAEDCELVQASGLPTIVVNTSFRMALWADVLFAMDAKWWRANRVEVAEKFKGRKLSMSHAARSWGAESLYGATWFISAHNSGAGAIGVAAGARAKRVILLGYDCQATGGKLHWHGDHPAPLGNAKSMKQWPKQFKYMSRDAGRVDCEVVNASRETSLTCFRRVKLEEVLERQREAA